MTPKTKAIELVDKYKEYVYCFMGSSMLTNDPDEGVILSNAKHCAIIAVDEILNDIGDYLGEINPKRYYWNQVKHEIQQL